MPARWGALAVGLWICSGVDYGGERATLADAAALMAAGEPAKAEAVLAAIVEREPENGAAWSQLAAARSAQQHHAAAAEAYAKADALGFLPLLTRYNLACALSLAGDREAALQALDRAADAGFRGVDVARTDPDLAPLLDDPRFAALLERFDRNARPCEFDPRHRALDFWIGDWEVVNAQGAPVGRNRIEKAQNGCVLIEHWTSRLGFHGTSLNYVDPATGKWRQNWADDSGGIVWYEGEIVGGAMHFAGENISRDGTKALARVLLRPLEGGGVHHSIEVSSDGGTTWTPYFDGTYRAAATGK